MPSIIKQGTVYGVPAKLGGLTDVTLSTPTSGQSLVYSNGAWVNQEAGGVFYGVCTTEPTVSSPQRIWTVTLNNGDGFTLTEGATVYIKFTHEETGDVYPTFPCLNVNDTGANPIYMNYTSGNAGYVPRWREGQVCVFTYDGNHKWFQINSVQSAYLTPYSNSSSGLTATNVQGAIDEVNTTTASKADKTLSAFNLTAGTGMTIQYVNCFAFGNLKTISANIIVGSGATTTIATVPSTYSASNTTFFYLGKNGGSGSYGYMIGTSLKTDSALSTGNYTINFVYR